MGLAEVNQGFHLSVDIGVDLDLADVVYKY